MLGISDGHFLSDEQALVVVDQARTAAVDISPGQSTPQGPGLRGGPDLEPVPTRRGGGGAQWVLLLEPAWAWWAVRGAP